MTTPRRSSGSVPSVSDDNEPAEDAPASAAPDPRDRRKGPRRTGADRRAGTTAPPGVERREGDRRATDRRSQPPVAKLYRGATRSINEYPLAADELEFINAVNAYKQRHQRTFPTWSEVLHIAKFLGYRKVFSPPSEDEDEDADETTAEAAADSPDTAGASGARNADEEQP